MTTSQIAIATLVVCFAVMVVYRIIDTRKTRRDIEGIAATEQAREKAAREQLVRTLENTIAVNQNSELLKENSALIRQLLEKQERPDE